MKNIQVKLGVLLATFLLFQTEIAFAVPILSKVVWSYDVTPNSLQVDRPGIFGVRSGRFTQSKQFGVSFGLYNFTNQSISITGITFDFWEDDGLVGDDLLVNNLALNIPTYHSLFYYSQPMFIWLSTLHFRSAGKSQTSTGILSSIYLRQLEPLFTISRYQPPT